MRSSSSKKATKSPVQRPMARLRLAAGEPLLDASAGTTVTRWRTAASGKVLLSGASSEAAVTHWRPASLLLTASETSQLVCVCICTDCSAFISAPTRSHTAVTTQTLHSLACPAWHLFDVDDAAGNCGCCVCGTCGGCCVCGCCSCVWDCSASRCFCMRWRSSSSRRACSSARADQLSCSCCCCWSQGCAARRCLQPVSRPPHGQRQRKLHPVLPAGGPGHPPHRPRASAGRPAPPLGEPPLRRVPEAVGAARHSADMQGQGAGPAHHAGVHPGQHRLPARLEALPRIPRPGVRQLHRAPPRRRAAQRAAGRPAERLAQAAALAGRRPGQPAGALLGPPQVIRGRRPARRGGAARHSQHRRQRYEGRL
eukprot:m.182189 g.182189  ORF g.182189 m.182189 type:complete len:368 (+) comp17456_c3_seq6:551-1654(+)